MSSSPINLAVRLLVLCLIFLSSTAAAQPRNLQVTPAGDHVLINKDVGDERWALSYDLFADTLTGTVYFESGQNPAFYDCTNTTPEDPETVNLSCSISNPGCGASPATTTACPQGGEWQPVATQPLPRSFFGLATSAVPVPPTCALPEAAADDRVVLFGSYEGDGISTVSVAGQDAETTTARVLIEPGADPLYVILSSFTSSIWRFEGAVTRVSRVVVVGASKQGVTGIPPDRVTDLSDEPGNYPDLVCFRPFYEVRTAEGVAARGLVERILGRSVDVFAGEYDVGTLSIPSATVSPGVASATPEGFDSRLYAEATRYYPGGLVAIEPAAVAPVGIAEPYEVFPATIGLAQLVGSGALELHGYQDYYIAKPIPRFPAGLSGALSVTFVLGRGVPLPAGDPGHSCVISEETGLPLLNSSICQYLL
jgi:hypothetical protein